MASIAELKLALEASRQRQITLAGATFTLRLPPQHEWRRAAESHRDSHGRVMETVAFRELLEKSIVMWANVPAAWLDESLTDKGLLDFGAETKTLLLDARQDIADRLTIALAEFRSERDQKFEALEKN